MTLTREERETIYRFDETQAPAMLWTNSPREVRRWERVGLAVEVDAGGWRATADKRQVGPRKLRTLQLSPENREARRVRLAQARAARLLGGNVDSNQEIEGVTS